MWALRLTRSFDRGSGVTPKEAEDEPRASQDHRERPDRRIGQAGREPPPGRHATALAVADSPPRESAGTVPAAPAGELTRDVQLVIRTPAAEERRAVERLALLDDRRLPAGDLIVAVVDGELWAAAPIGGGEGVADPFRPSGNVLAALQAAARTLRRPATASRPVAGRRTRVRRSRGRYLRRGGATAFEQVRRARA